MKAKSKPTRRKPEPASQVAARSAARDLRNDRAGIRLVGLRLDEPTRELLAKLAAEFGGRAEAVTYALQLAERERLEKN